MSEGQGVKLPHSWVRVELAQLVHIHYGKALAAKDRESSGHFPVVGSSGVVGLHDQALVEGPCLIVGRKGAAGAVHYVSESCWPIDTAYWIQPTVGLSLKFLFYVLASFNLVELDKSTAIPSLSRDDLRRVSISLPPTDEQNRILDKIEELLSDLDAGVAELKAAQKKLAQYRQSLLKDAVEGQLTQAWRGQRGDSEESGRQMSERILRERRTRWETKQIAKFDAQGRVPSKGWREQYREPVGPILDGLPSLPDCWAWVTLDQLTEFITSGSRGWADYYAKEGALFIRSQNINRDRLDLAEVAHVNPPENSEGARTKVEFGDLLLTITGANVGKVASVLVELDDAYVSQHVALIRPIELRLTSFLHLFLTSVVGGRGQLDKEAYGAGKPGLNLRQVAAVFVPLPRAAEVIAIVDEVERQFVAIAAQEEALTKALRQSATQRKNILQAAFSGQLIPQDPTDEPASVLLERIRAQRVRRSPTRGKSNVRAKRASA